MAIQCPAFEGFSVTQRHRITDNKPKTQLAISRLSLTVDPSDCDVIALLFRFVTWVTCVAFTTSLSLILLPEAHYLPNWQTFLLTSHIHHQVSLWHAPAQKSPFLCLPYRHRCGGFSAHLCLISLTQGWKGLNWSTRYFQSSTSFGLLAFGPYSIVVVPKRRQRWGRRRRRRQRASTTPRWQSGCLALWRFV